MKRIFIVTMLLIILTGCGKEMNKKTREKYEKDTAQNITMRIKEGTLKKGSATIIIEDLNPNNKEDIFGISFVLYEKIGNEWVSLPPKVDEYGWTLRDYHVNDKNILEMETNWEWLYGELKPGQYKIAKGLVVEDKSYTFSTDFTIK